MSDGGRERRKSNESTDPAAKPGTDSFSRAIVRVGVAQICENEGFQGFQRSALEALSDIAVRYMVDIGKTAVSAANFAGRTEPNAFDVIHGVEDLHSVMGFSGASDIDRCLLSSGAVREILNYVYGSEEIPFAYPLPMFPVSRDRTHCPSFTQSGEEPPLEHIPRWLPIFPGCETLEEKADPMKSKTSSLNLTHGIICNGSGQLSKGVEDERDSQINPFLAEPICSGGVKEVYPVALPPRLVDPQFVNGVVENHRELGKQVSPDNSNDHETGPKVVLLKQRPAVQFKIKSHKKIPALALDSIFRAEGIPEKNHFLIHDNGINSESEWAEKAQKESPTKITEDRALL